MIEPFLAVDFWLPDTPPRVDRITLDHDVDVDVVRDDLLHPIAGGNKLRKLDAVLPIVASRSPGVVVTCGGAQSSHAATVAVMGAQMGVPVDLLLRGERPEIPTGYTLVSLIHAHVSWVSRSRYANREAMFARYLERCSHSDPMVIPEGAGARDALHGLVRQVSQLSGVLGSDPRRLVVDCGTGTTAVGLALGVALLGLPWEVHGVMLMRDTRIYADQLSRLLTAAAELQKNPLTAEELPLEWYPRQPPRRFGKILDGEVEHCARLARSTGVLFDPIYTLASVQHVLSSRPHGQPAVIIHTGGTLNAFGVAQRVPADRWSG